MRLRRKLVLVAVLNGLCSVLLGIVTASVTLPHVLRANVWLSWGLAVVLGAVSLAAVGWLAVVPQDHEPSAGIDLAASVTEYLHARVAFYEERSRRHRRDPQRNLLGFYIEPRGVSASDEQTGHASALPIGELLAPAIEAGRPCLVLADFGMGKTWLLEMLQYRLAQAVLSAGDQNGARAVLAADGNAAGVPFLLPLRGFDANGRPDGESVLDRVRRVAWREAVGESTAIAHEPELIEAFERGRFVFLLDALDEMPGESTEEFLTSIGALARYTRRSPVVVTARRGMFDERARERRLEDHGFEVFNLLPWSAAEIGGYVVKAAAAGLVAGDPADLLTTLTATYHVRDLATRAMLTAMLMEQWDRIAAGQSIDVLTLYERHVEDRLLDWQAKRTLRLTKDKLRVSMEQIAWTMFERNELTLHAGTLDRYLAGKARELGVPRFGRIARELARDVKVGSLLVRDGDAYTFCHVSIWEFFVARRLYRALLHQDTAAFAVTRRATRYQSIIENFLGPMLRRDGRADLLTAVLQEPS